MQATVLLEFLNQHGVEAFEWNAFDMIPGLVNWSEMDVYRSNQSGGVAIKAMLEFDDPEDYAVFEWNAFDLIPGLADWSLIKVYKR